MGGLEIIIRQTIFNTLTEIGLSDRKALSCAVTVNLVYDEPLNISKVRKQTFEFVGALNLITRNDEHFYEEWMDDAIVMMFETQPFDVSEDEVTHWMPGPLAIAEQTVELLQVDPVVMVPYLKNRADAVDGHYCIARVHPKGYHEFWNEKQKEWCSAGSVFELGKAT